MGTAQRLLVADTHLKKAGAITSGMLVALVAFFSIGLPASGDPADLPLDTNSVQNPSTSQLLALSNERELTGPNLIFPAYNESGVDELVNRLAPLMRASDTVLLVSGNNDRELDIAWLRRSVDRISSAVHGVTVYAMTAGLENVRQIRDADVEGISGIVYDYENHFPNEPEFDYDFELTLANFRAFHAALEGFELRSIALPTGLPLAKTWAQKWEWDYAEINVAVDSLIIQTQSYCLSSVEDFGVAVEKGDSQHLALRLDPTIWTPQVTVDPNSTNGVTPARAVDCANLALETGHEAIMVWWSPRFTDEAIEFINLMRP